jgi:hypothetical protein
LEEEILPEKSLSVPQQTNNPTATMNQLELPKDFWSTVKLEIEAAKIQTYPLCGRSITFAVAWDNKKLAEKIQTLAKNYLSFRPANYTVGCSFLFVRLANSGISSTEAKQFRTDFVNWCVENNY